MTSEISGVIALALMMMGLGRPREQPRILAKPKIQPPPEIMAVEKPEELPPPPPGYAWYEVAYPTEVGPPKALPEPELFPAAYEPPTLEQYERFEEAAREAREAGEPVPITTIPIGEELIEVEINGGRTTLPRSVVDLYREMGIL